MTPTRVASLALSAALLALPAGAAPIAITLTGYVNAVFSPPAPFGSVATNDAASLTLYIDDATPDANPSPTIGWYGLGITGYSFTIGAANIFSNSLSLGPSDFSVQNAVSDTLGFNVYDVAFGVNVILHGDGSLFSSDAFPSASELSAALANANFATGTLGDEFVGTEYVRVTWTDASMASVVPLPASALLAAAGLAPITLVRRRR